MQHGKTQTIKKITTQALSVITILATKKPFIFKSEYTFFLILPFDFYYLLLTPSCHENKVTKDTAFNAVMTQLSCGSPSNNAFFSF